MRKWLVIFFLFFQISDAFKKFGISDSDTAVLIVLVVDGDKNVNLADIASQVEGQQVSLDELPQLTDTAKVKKVCKREDWHGEKGQFIYLSD